MSFKQTVFISDTHGFRDVWERLFVQMGLMDEEGNWLREDEVRLVHNGDNVDRGEDSYGLWQKIRSRRNTIRTFGNHDFGYAGGPEFGGMEAEVWKFADEIVQDGADGKMVFAWRFVENNGTEWMVCHAGLVPAWTEFHNMPMQEAVDEINRLGQKFMASQKGKDWHNVLGAVGWSRGGNLVKAGVTWADYHIDLIPYEKKIKHRQIVGHTIQPNGITLSKGGKVWGINVHYDHAQALVYDHEAGLWSKSVLLTPPVTPYVGADWQWEDEDSQFDQAGFEEFMKAEDEALNARLQRMFDSGSLHEAEGA